MPWLLYLTLFPLFSSRPVKILFDFSNFEPATSEQFEFFSKAVFPDAAGRVSAWLTLKAPALLPKLKSTLTCKEISLTVAAQFWVDFDADILIFPLFKDSLSLGYLASASICSQAPNGRPIAGAIFVNAARIASTRSGFAQAVRAVEHEILHLLLLTPEAFLASPGTRLAATASGGGSLVFVSPALIAHGRNQMNCSEFAGLLAEDGGSASSRGSHFDKSLAGDELMTAALPAMPLVTRYTMGVFGDSSWFSADFSFAGRSGWGRAAGCGFLKRCGGGSPPFCEVEGVNGCSADRLAKARCVVSSLAGGCGIFEPGPGDSSDCRRPRTPDSPLEERGPGSRCVTAIGADNGVLALCLRMRCEGKAKMFVTIAQKEYDCSQGGGKISIQGMIVECPLAEVLCEVSPPFRCKNDCGGRGACVEGGFCVCDPGFGGEDCSGFPKNLGVSSELGAKIFGGSMKVGAVVAVILGVGW